MLIDLHAHSSKISWCCQITGDEVINRAINCGIDGIVLTNHYQKYYFNDGDSLSFAKRYIEEFYDVKSYGDKIGFKVFFGLEVTLHKYDDSHVLIYGVDEDFVLKYHDMYNYDLEYLFKIVHENNGILVQAHPYRKSMDGLLDLNYLDGIEVNCHPLYNGTHFDKLSDIASNYNKILTCGGDYHADTYRPKCGVYLPDEITDTFKMVTYLTNVNYIRMCIQEVDGSLPFEYIYKNN